ncbi:hypothetical protein H0G86_000185 [Trichoderma simmonsii]|uniref:Polyketide synthase dehydratase domain-containing protein n=1 Tax=Trichoderma simmonsii TaxID=1491479 RepID=A0A8G0L167_9HYPO|nr:hypothetical protein H0G86_000185 [Trichoderma simmonsii]
MAGEFAAHISGHRHGYALRQVVIKAAMDLNDGEKATFKLDEPEPVGDVELPPRRLPMGILYDCMGKVGLSFSPLFQRLSDIRTGTAQGLASGNLVDLEIYDDEEYLLHPTVIDAALQLPPITSFRGRIKSSLFTRVLTHIDSLMVHRPVSRADITLWATAESAGSNDEASS